jgi:hypothetical protein
LCAGCCSGKEGGLPNSILPSWTRNSPNCVRVPR